MVEKIKTIIEQLDVWYFHNLKGMLKKLFFQYYLAISLTLLFAFIIEIADEIEGFVILPVMFPALVIMGPIGIFGTLLLTYQYEVKPALKEVKEEIRLERKWKPLINRFNKTY